MSKTKGTVTRIKTKTNEKIITPVKELKTKTNNAFKEFRTETKAKYDAIVEKLNEAKESLTDLYYKPKEEKMTILQKTRMITFMEWEKNEEKLARRKAVKENYKDTYDNCGNSTKVVIQTFLES